MSGKCRTVGVADAYALALTAFRETLTADDPAAAFAAGMRHVCHGYECGVLSAEDRPRLDALILAAEQALERATVPALLSEQTFEDIAARMPDLVALWCEPEERRAARHPAYAPGFRAMIRYLANVVENISLHDIACRGNAELRDLVETREASAFAEGRDPPDARAPHPRTCH